MVWVGHSLVLLFWCGGAVENETANESGPADNVEWVKSMPDRPGDAMFRKLMEPLVLNFITDNLERYNAGKLTFRHLKNNLSAEMKMPYDAFRRYELIIENYVDEITNKIQAAAD